MKFLKKLVNIQSFLIIIFLVILTQKFDFFKNTYLLTQKTINERYQKVAFDFCKKNSSGYVFYIKEKFRLKEKPLIINYNIAPDQNWIFKKDNINEKSDDIILLNYKMNKTYNFIKIKGLDYWVSYDMATPGTTKGGKYFEFIGDVKNLNTKHKANFYKKEIAVLTDVKKIKFDYKKSIYDYEFKPGDTDLGGVTFGILKKGKKYILSENNINFDDHDSLKFIKFDDNFDDSGITEIRLHLNDNIDLSKYEILDNFKNKCMYLAYNND